MWAKGNETLKDAAAVFRDEIMYVFGNPRVSVKNGPSFTATALSEFVTENRVAWKLVSINAPQENGRAEHMMTKMNSSIAKIALSSKGDWDNAITRFDKARKGRKEFETFWLMLWKEPRLKVRGTCWMSFV